MTEFEFFRWILDYEFCWYIIMLTRQNDSEVVFREHQKEAVMTCILQSTPDWVGYSDALIQIEFTRHWTLNRGNQSKCKNEQWPLTIGLLCSYLLVGLCHNRVAHIITLVEAETYMIKTDQKSQEGFRGPQQSRSTSPKYSDGRNLIKRGKNIAVTGRRTQRVHDINFPPFQLNDNTKLINRFPGCV